MQSAIIASTDEALASEDLPCIAPPEEVEQAPPAPPKLAHKRHVPTPLGGQQCVWFSEITERLERLWIAAVHNTIIATVLGEGITPVAVHSKATRMGLLPRTGLPLVKDLEVARKIDEEAAPLPTLVKDHRGKTVRRRICSLTGTVFWSQFDIVSAQAKETDYYRNQMVCG